MPYTVEQLKIPSSRTAGNRYDVPKKQWNKWPDASRRIFNYVFYTMIHNQKLFSHPKAERVPADHWRTVCWNAAWEAACGVQEHAKLH